MTTLAFKDGTLASDSQVSENSFASGKIKKVYRLTYGDTQVLLGCWGGVANWHVAIKKFKEKFLSSGKIPDDLGCLMHETSLYVIVKNKGKRERIYEYNCNSQILEVTRKNNILGAGSGGQLATGALHAGASAREAIEIACQFDNFSSGPIQSVSFR